MHRPRQPRLAAADDDRRHDERVVARIEETGEDGVALTARTGGLVPIPMKSRQSACPCHECCTTQFRDDRRRTQLSG
jgi:hypothetical protein